MFSTINLYRIKMSIWFRQMYMPGVRGAAAIILVNIIVILTIRLIARRMARIALEQTNLVAKPAKRRFAFSIANK